MWVLFLEMFVALSLFIFIIWWTMFAPKKKDETHESEIVENTKKQNSDTLDNTQK